MPGEERKLAVTLFNRVWELMETDPRTPEENDELIHAAHASRYHWGNVGEPANSARGEWQCSRMYTVLGRADAALWHAQRCLEICTQNRIGDWDLAYAYEALARAYGLAGEADESAHFLDLARAVEIAEDEDREHLLDDLETIS
jgi:DMSO reductase anchor subunit